MNCLATGREEVADVGLALCHHPLIRKVSFTGSTDVGKWLMRESSSTMKRVSEMTMTVITKWAVLEAKMWSSVLFLSSCHHYSLHQ